MYNTLYIPNISRLAIYMYRKKKKSKGYGKCMKLKKGKIQPQL